MSDFILGGDVVAKSLVVNGIEVLFGIPGVQLDPIFAGLHDEQDNIRIIHARHEQGVALMAFGYSHVTRKTGAMMVVPGPGFLNATTGMLVAHACNAPLLCLVGQSELMYISSGLGVLHELDNQIGIAKSMTKWAQRVEEPTAISSTITEALDATRHHRPRPVYVELPTDIVRMEVQCESINPASEEAVYPQIDSADVEAVAMALASARFPMIMAGGGATHANKSIQRLAEMLGAPVGMSENGLGTLDCRHPLSFTQMGANRLWQRADVVLALGTRLYSPIYHWGYDDELAIFKVDVDDEELGRLPIELEGVHAECDEFVEKLCELLPEYLSEAKDLQNDFTKVRGEVEDMLAPMSLHREILESIREEIGESGILVADVTQMNHACMDALPVYGPRTYISSGYQGALGYGLCTALGAKVGKPEETVICMTGDGGFMYAAQELATAVQFDIPVVVLVINDGAYKNVENILNGAYDGKAIATTLENPDFVTFAKSFGVEGRQVSSPSEMQQALKELIATNKPTLIDYKVDEIPSVFWTRFLPKVRKCIPENNFGLVK